MMSFQAGKMTGYDTQRERNDDTEFSHLQINCDKISPIDHTPSDLYRSTRRKRRFQAMYEDALARVDLFSGLRKKELKDLSAYCREGEYSPGAVLIPQGEQGLGLFILTKGTVRITRANSPDGAEEVLGTAGAGDVIGEMALLDDMH